MLNTSLSLCSSMFKFAGGVLRMWLAHHSKHCVIVAFQQVWDGMTIDMWKLSERYCKPSFIATFQWNGMSTVDSSFQGEPR